MESTYRADIDGLRGIAVLAVVLFHAGYASFSGGYVGVDVFFVISGYLITNLIIKEIQANEFSIARFYERRIRRIFPALFVTIAITLAVGAVLLIPADFKSLGKSATAVTLFVSNVLFWKETGYFNLSAEYKPLLHTWSLAVEEQFYLVFPLILIGIRRLFRARFAACVSVLAAASFVFGLYHTYHHASAAFYFSPTRAWELFIGALIACRVLPSTGESKRTILAGLGLVLIAISIIAFDPGTPFPGFAALMPTLGAALIIYAGSDGMTIVGRGLSARPLVFIGLISYSLYLLHWPLMVFVRYYAIVELTGPQTFALLLASVALSAVSWRFIERPFRSKQLLNRTQLFALSSAAMLAAITIGVFIDRGEGIPQRFSSSQLDHLADSASPWMKRCDYVLPDAPQGLCSAGAESPNISRAFLLWGDSHANMLALGVGQSALAQSVGGYVATASGCPPMLNWGEPWCTTFNDAIFSYVRQRPELKTIVLAARWARWSSGVPYGTEEGMRKKLLNGDRTGADKSGLFDLRLRQTVKTLLEMGRDVVLVEPIPEIGYSVPQAYAVALRTGRDVSNLIAPTRDEYDLRNHTILAVLNSLEGLKGVHIVHVSEKMCDASSCRVLDSGRSLYSDDNHVSIFGSQYVSSLFDGLLKGRTVLSTGQTKILDDPRKTIF